MKRLKKILRLLGLVLLIVLAGVGLGFGGGVPIPTSNKREDTTEINIEWVEPNEDQTKSIRLDIKQ